MSIAVKTTSYQASDKSWKRASVYPNRGGTLDISAFTANTHYPNGYIPAGTAVGLLTATHIYAPYLNGGSGGAEVCAGLTAEDVIVPNLLDTTKDAPFALMEDGIVIQAKLPFQSGAGSIDSAAKADLAGFYKWL